MSFDTSIFNKDPIVEWAYTEEAIPKTYSKYEAWLSRGLQGPLGYLADHRSDIRQDLKKFYPDFKSSIVFLFSYASEKKVKEQNCPALKVASYVTGFEGVDYHHYIKDRLQVIASSLQNQVDGLEYALTIDAQPVLERDLAYRAGLGWFGKNSMIINREHGSYFIIAGLLLNKTLDLPSKQVDVDHCGSCRACIDACPTSAILKDSRSVDSSKCISTFTIELFKEADPPQGYKDVSEIYGCDICQEVCPWNRRPIKNVVAKSETNLVTSFFARDVNSIINDLEKMSNREFKRQFKSTPLERTGRVGVLKNLKPFLKD